MSEQDEIRIVDDAPVVLRLLTDILSAEGFLVRSASNGELALQSVAANPPQLILLDIDMPDKNVESPWPLAEIVHQHHERMDGSGYPRNLKGEEICMGARIIAVADVVKAMAAHRPYRPAFRIEKALEEIEKNKGILYDQPVAEACLRVFREKGFQFEGK